LRAHFALLAAEHHSPWAACFTWNNYRKIGQLISWASSGNTDDASVSEISREEQQMWFQIQIFMVSWGLYTT